MVSEFTKPEVVAHVKNLNSGKYGVDKEVKATLEVPKTSYRKLSLKKYDNVGANKCDEIQRQTALILFFIYTIQYFTRAHAERETLRKKGRGVCSISPKFQAMWGHTEWN